MPRFFIEKPIGDTVPLDTETSRHIARALRMRAGDGLTLCDGQGIDYAAAIQSVAEGAVSVRILSSAPCVSEPALGVTLFQCVPKADKLEQIVRQTVELGVGAVVPVFSRYTVPQKKADARQKQLSRLRAISKSAAEQSGRGIIPRICEHIGFEEMASMLPSFDAALFFYEHGGRPLQAVLSELPRDIKTMAVIVGAEGGFHEDEAARLQECGAIVCSLGPRILRCETAPVVALGNVFCAFPE